jgi:hypothetical protein
MTLNYEQSKKFLFSFEKVLIDKLRFEVKAMKTFIFSTYFSFRMRISELYKQIGLVGNQAAPPYHK